MSRTHRRTLGALILGAAVTIAASAQTITGTVVDQATGLPVSGATIHFSGTSSPSSVVTDLTGTFTSSINPGTYTVDVEPPVTTLAPNRIEGVVVTSGTVNLGTIALAPGLLLSGHVQTQTGTPVVNGDTDVIAVPTGQKLYTPSDNTDLSGNFQVVVPAGTYRVEADTPAGQLLVAQQTAAFTMTSAFNVGTIVLPPGVTLSGSVLSSQTFLGIANVDIDVDDMVTGVRIITPTDKTDSSGFFSVIVPTGLYRVAFDPPPGVPIVAAELFNVPVLAALGLGNIFLGPGFLLSGTVLNPQAQPVVGADIDVVNTLGGLKVYTPNDATNASGSFQVAVPGGTYRVKIAPLPVPLLAPAVSNPVVVSGPTTVPTVTLAAGNVLSGTILGWNGAPEASATLDVVDPVTGAELFTPNDTANAAGVYSVVVPAGTWNVRIRAPHISLSRNTLVTGVVVSGPTTLNQTLSLVPVASYLVASGVNTIPNGSFLPTDAALFNPTLSVQTVNLSLSVIDPAGVETFLVAGVPVTFQPFDLIVFLGFPVLPPPSIPAYLGFPSRLRLTVTDPVSAAVLDSDDFHFTQL